MKPRAPSRTGTRPSSRPSPVFSRSCSCARECRALPTCPVPCGRRLDTPARTPSAAGLAGDAHDSPAAWGQRVVARPVAPAARCGPKGADRAVDEPRVAARATRRRPGRASSARPGPQALDEDVGGVHECAASTSWPRRRSTHTERSLAFTVKEQRALRRPRNGGPQVRASSSAAHGLILTTSAPSALQISRANTDRRARWVMSTTRVPRSGRKVHAGDAIQGAHMFDQLVNHISGEPWAYLIVFALVFLDAVIPLFPSSIGGHHGRRPRGRGQGQPRARDPGRRRRRGAR